MTLTRKEAKTAPSAATAEDILQAGPESVVSGEREKDKEENVWSKKCKKAIL